MVDWGNDEEVREYQRLYREINRLNKERLCECGNKLEKYKHFCPDCRKVKAEERVEEYQKEYRDRPDVKARAKEYYEKYAKEYYEKNKERVAEWSKRYWVKNKDRVKEYRQRPDVKKKRRVYNRRYLLDKYKNDVQYNIRMRLAGSFNFAIKRYKDEARIAISKNKNIDYGAIIEHLKPFPEDVENYHIDHIIPLNFFDLNDSEQVAMAWNPINFQWLKGSDNISKNDTIDFNKYPEQKLAWDKLELNKYQLTI